MNHSYLIINLVLTSVKTARKPYDYAVRIILREALTRGYITDLSDDGINEEIISDDEYIK